MRRVTPPAAIGVFGNNPRSALFTWGKRAGAFRPTTRSRPRLGLVVRCGDLALSQEAMIFVRFFLRAAKYQNNALFVNTEDFFSAMF